MTHEEVLREIAGRGCRIGRRKEPFDMDAPEVLCFEACDGTVPRDEWCSNCLAMHALGIRVERQPWRGARG